jgi:hypothetical protein
LTALKQKQVLNGLEKDGSLQKFLATLMTADNPNLVSSLFVTLATLSGQILEG